jgi:SpoVK/Ycf46/Vps4 family AAA+-type ATPase
MASDINFEQLAFLTNGFVGADLVSLCREAALIVLLDSDRNSEKVCSNLVNVNSFSRKGIPNVRKELFLSRCLFSVKDLGHLSSPEITKVKFG